MLITENYDPLKYLHMNYTYISSAMNQQAVFPTAYI